MTTRWMRRQAARSRDEMLGMFVSCIGAAAILAFVSPRLLLGAYGIFLSIAAGISILLAVFCHLRQGGSMAGALILVLLTGSLTAGSMYGIWWYCFVHLASQPDLLGLGSIGQVVPQQSESPFAQPDNLTNSKNPLSEAVVAPPIPSTTDCGSAFVQGVEGLALRAEATKQAAQLGVVPRGGSVVLFCTPTVTVDDIVWQKVRYDDIEGWMSSRFLRLAQP